LLHEGQVIAARSAFIEAYQARVALARANRQQPKWTPSLGHDPAGRETALKAAVEHGRIGYRQAQVIMPSLPPIAPKMLAVVSGIGKA
jgi:hypothetical protein